jgi:hypothetical protein
LMKNSTKNSTKPPVVQTLPQAAGDCPTSSCDYDRAFLPATPPLVRTLAATLRAASGLCLTWAGL